MTGPVRLTATFFVVVMIALLVGMEHGHWFRGAGPASKDFPELSYRQVTIFFTVYVFLTHPVIGRGVG